MPEQLPRIGGYAVQVVSDRKRRELTLADVQVAIEAAAIGYMQRYGVAPTHVALPAGVCVCPAIVNGKLKLAKPTGPGWLIVGHPVCDGHEFD